MGWVKLHEGAMHMSRLQPSGEAIIITLPNSLVDVLHFI